jgi:hypothetical protein
MTEESVGSKTDLKTKGKKETTAQDKKSGGTTDKKAEKRENETSTLEGQKRVTKTYRSGWKRIWGSKK